MTVRDEGRGGRGGRGGLEGQGGTRGDQEEHDRVIPTLGETTASGVTCGTMKEDGRVGKEGESNGQPYIV